MNLLASDKDLFLYDLAVAAILKNEGHYIREWLDYHLLAGVDHFYLYDNGSSDNYAEIIAPYVAAGLVTSKYFPGESMQFAAYDDAVLNYRFRCRHMAFIDLDEFIYPKTNRSISEVVDKILSRNKNASGVVINWQLYGSSGQETADYSRGVLERFTRRAPVDWLVPIPDRDIPGGNAQVKTIADPRRIAFFTSAHFPIYYEENFSVNENGKRVDSYCNEPVTANEIVLNHYNVKSREEHREKILKGRAGKKSTYLDDAWFDMYDRNEEFDDGILKYRAAREKIFSLKSDKQRIARVRASVIKILSAYASGARFSLETALTCRAASTYLQEKIFEEASLAAILKSLDGIKISDVRLLLSELPNLLTLPYPVVEELGSVVLQIIRQTMNFMREHELWKDFSDMENLRRLLQAFR